MTTGREKNRKSARSELKDKSRKRASRRERAGNPQFSPDCADMKSRALEEGLLQEALCGFLNWATPTTTAAATVVRAFRTE